MWRMPWPILSSDISSLFKTGAKNNFISFSDKMIDLIIDQSKQTRISEERKLLNYKLHLELQKRAPYAFLWSLDKVAAWNTKIQRVRIHPFTFFTHFKDWYIPVDYQ